MKDVLAKLSFTKLTFLMVILVLCISTTRVVFNGEYDELTKTILGFFGTTLIAMTSFYFGQKTALNNVHDSLIKEDLPSKK